MHVASFLLLLLLLTTTFRFVGAELLVTMEDADLSLVLDCKQSDNPIIHTTTSYNRLHSLHRADSLDSQTTQKTNNYTNTTQSNNPIQKDQFSIGEKVVENNILAKVLSMIPNLHLVNCRVRLTFKDYSPQKQNYYNNSQNGNSNNNNNYNNNRTELDTTLVLGIDFLSVTTGQEFISHVQTQVNSQQQNKSATTKQCSIPTCRKTKTNNTYQR